MAVTSQGTVFAASANADVIPGPLSVDSILWIPGTATAASLAVNGVTIWSGANARVADNLPFRADSGVTVTLTGGTGTIYLYTEVE